MYYAISLSVLSATRFINAQKVIIFEKYKFSIRKSCLTIYNKISNIKRISVKVI